MKRMKTYIALLAVVVAALLPASARTQSANIQVAHFAYRYDLDNPTLEFCRAMGQGNSPWGTHITGIARIKTTGSNVAVTAVTAGSLPFAQLGVDDWIQVFNPTTRVFDNRTIVAKTDGDTIEVDTAVNWDNGGLGVPWKYKDVQCGTTDSDGWVDASGLATKLVCFQLEQINGVTGGIDLRVHQRSSAEGSLPNPLHPGSDTAAKCNPGTLASQYCNFTTAGETTGRFCVSVPRDLTSSQLRIGLKINTADAAEGAEANKERITMWIEKESER